MKTKITSIILLALFILSALVLASCSESEPLPEGVSALPDLDASELTASLADESGVIQWPAELLPEGFPVPKYEEIFSVEREDNEVRIVLLAKWDKRKDDPPDQKLTAELYRQGYVFYMPRLHESSTMPCVNRDGLRVQMETLNTDAIYGHLKDKYGYVYSVSVRMIVPDYPESIFWKYPSSGTDLGYESKELAEWPANLLPDNVPRPADDEIVKMESRPSGIFITLKEINKGGNDYRQSLFDAGYVDVAMQPYPDENGNYFFYEYVTVDTATNSKTTTFQFCRFNDKVEK